MYKTCVQALATAFVFAVCFMVGTAGAADWEKLPGTAKDVGEGWIITADPSDPDRNIIQRWNGVAWENMPGTTVMPDGALRIGGTYLQPWVVDSNRSVYRWTGSDWELMLSGPVANDVGEGWIVNLSNDVQRWNGFSWDPMAAPVSVVAIGGTYLQPWVVDEEDNVHRWTGSVWESVPGAPASDASEGWAIGTGPGVTGGNTIWRWTGSEWQTIGGAAVRVGGTALDTWVVNAVDDIYRLQF